MPSTLRTPARGGLVDVHAHVLPPGYVEAAVAAGHTTPDGMPAWPVWSLEQHLRLMDEAGIELAVLSLSSPGVDLSGQNSRQARALATAVNDYVAELCARHPDRFRFFATLPLPAMDAALAELERACDDLGAVGAVLTTHAGGRYPSDPVMTPLWQQFQARGTTVFLHPTSPPGWPQTALGLPRPLLEFMVETTRAVVGLVEHGTLAAYPAVEVVVPHCGALLPAILDRWELFATLPAGQEGAGMSRTEESGSRELPAAGLQRLWFDLAGTPLPHNAAALIQRVGTDRILYGSDHCFTPADAVRRQIDSLDAGWRDVADTPWRTLTTRNAHALLGTAYDPTKETSC